MELSTVEPPLASRWYIFSSCLLIAGVCGLTTAFGLLSPSLESDLEYSASEIALVASFGNLGTFSGFLAGLMIDHLGPRRAVFIGSIFIWFGLFFIWLSVEKRIESSVASVCIFIYIAQLGSATMSQASSSTSMLIMPSAVHGEVASIAKAYYGIAGGVLSSIAGTFYEDKEKGFVLFASIFMPLGTFFGGVFLDLLPEKMISFDNEKSEGISTSLQPYYVHFTILVLIILVTAALYLSENSGGPIVHQTFGSIVLFWVIAIITMKYLFYSPGSGQKPDDDTDRLESDAPTDSTEPVPHANRSSMIDEELIKYEMQAQAIAEHRHAKAVAKLNQTANRDSSGHLDASILPRASAGSGYDEFDHRASRVSLFRASLASQYKSKYGEDLNLWQMLQTGRFYTTFIIQSTHYGGTLLLINLIEPIATSHGVKAGPFLVLLISLSSAFGRIVIGYISKRFKDSVSLVGLMGYCNLGVAIVNVVLALYIKSEYLFYLLVLCTGALYGTMTVLSAAIVVSLFGVTYVATNDGMYDLSGAVGSYVIAFGAVAMFPPHTNKDDDDGGCVGADCYQEAFFLSSAVCVFGFVLSLITDRYLKMHDLVREEADE